MAEDFEVSEYNPASITGFPRFKITYKENLGNISIREKLHECSKKLLINISHLSTKECSNLDKIVFSIKERMKKGQDIYVIFKSDIPIQLGAKRTNHDIFSKIKICPNFILNLRLEQDSIILTQTAYGIGNNVFYELYEKLKKHNK